MAIRVRRLSARIITGKAEYVMELHLNYMRSPIWKIGCETQKQLESEQYILQKGFKRIK
jgi:hypothetical protein